MRNYVSDQRGAAALEFALWLTLLTVPLLNAIDLGFYAFQSIQVHEAAQVAAQAAEELCSPKLLIPAATQCTSAAASPGLNTELTNAAQSTSLGTKVTVSSSASKSNEGWYCSNTSGGLTLVGSTWALSTSSTPSSEPACSGTVSKNSNNAGDYITVSVTYTFHPLFGSVSVANLLGSTITQTSTMRLT